MYSYMYVYVYVYVCVCVYVNVDVVDVDAYVYVYVYVHVVYICVCMHVHICVCVCVCLHVYKLAKHIDIHILSTDVWVWTYVFTWSATYGRRVCGLAVRAMCVRSRATRILGWQSRIISFESMRLELSSLLEFEEILLIPLVGARKEARMSVWPGGRCGGMYNIPGPEVELTQATKESSMAPAHGSACYVGDWSRLWTFVLDRSVWILVSAWELLYLHVEVNFQPPVK